MKAGIRDKKALAAVSPAALAAWARSAGWVRSEPFGDRSDVYVADDRPEIVLPRTRNLGDYENVVRMLIEIFAETADMDDIALYRDLVTADRDTVRVRATESGDGSVTLNDGIALVNGARAMVLAAACSAHDPQPFYRAGANREARDYVRRMRLGQTEQGSFVVTLLSPVVSSRMSAEFDDPDSVSDVDPVERRVTTLLAGALEATRRAIETAVSGDNGAFLATMTEGASANLFKALHEMMNPFPRLEVSLTWARTRPAIPARKVVRFARDDAPILREAARLFRARGAQPDIRLTGYIHKLRRSERETEGTVTLRAAVSGKIRSVTAVLKRSDYEQAIRAHKEKAPIVAEGDLERSGHRWHLTNPRIIEAIFDEDKTDEEIVDI